MTPRAPNVIDGLVGSRVKQQRLARGLSLEQLGDALGVTVPQVMKYERGLNRIGAGRLHAIAGLLGVPIAFFFEGHAPAEADAAPVASQAPDQSGPDPSLFADRQTIELAMAFARISSPQMRRALLEMAHTAAAEAAAAAAGSSGPEEGRAPEGSVSGQLVRLGRAWPGRKPALERAAGDQAARSRA